LLVVAVIVGTMDRHMTAQLWKRDPAEPRVTFRCPLCDVVGVSSHEDRADVWLLAGCPHYACRRGVLIRVPSVAPWDSLDTGDDGMLLAATCVLPRSP
jgi:hypothetical protein